MCTAPLAQILLVEISFYNNLNTVLYVCKIVSALHWPFCCIILFLREFLEKKTKLDAVLSVGLMVNLRSSTLILRISDQGKLIFGSSLFSLS